MLSGAALGVAVSEPAGAVVAEAWGDTLIEMEDSLVVSRLLGENVFGCTPFELEGRSVLEIMHPDDHEPFMQTARALVAMAAGTSLAVGVRLYSVHALHRVSHHREGKVFEVMVDSLITATRPNRMGAEAGLTMSSRRALVPCPGDGEGSFRVFPMV